MQRKFVSLFLLSLFFLIISVCFISCVRTRAMLGGKIRIDVTISEKANQSSPVALDLLMIADEELLDQLLKLTAKQWFERRDQIKKDYLKDSGLKTWEWEWVPGQAVPIIEIPLQPQAEGAIIFADYHTPGAHRFRIDPAEDILIYLDENDASVEIME